MDKSYHISDRERAILTILREHGADALAILELGREALRCGRGHLQRARLCLELGAQELRNSERTVSFFRAARAAAEAREHRRARTLKDFCYVTRRFMKRCPDMARRRMRSIKPDECAAWIQRAFDTPSQRRKARSILSGVFSTACKLGWCSSNPVRHVPIPPVEEKRINILTAEEMQRLLHTATVYRSGECLPAVGLMLYAGIRPHEVERLTWEDIDTQEGMIRIQPKHSKTGSARCVTIHPPLAKLLQRAGAAQRRGGAVCPENWRRKWAALRRKAGWDPSTHPWQPDVLRHTFATHHLAAFHSYAELQMEMGHRSADLLRTRYVGIRPTKEKMFFEGREKRGTRAAQSGRGQKPEKTGRTCHPPFSRLMIGEKTL